MFRFSALIAGASLQAAQVVDAGATRVAFNIAGGLYHGMPSRASGFCYLNDVVLAIGTGQVLTIFLHESSKYLFPGTSFEDEIGEGAGLLHECPECPAPPVYGR
jgi:acetoin utilization protein AcuC